MSKVGKGVALTVVPEAANASYLSGLESDLEPARIVQTRSKEGVISFLKTIKPFMSTFGFASAQGINVKDGVIEIAAGERQGAMYAELTLTASHSPVDDPLYIASETYR
ncbi:unnamed protein product [Clonostachys solani]|uniref:Uncharacterized protein n=1 Tax=Clonostachys solani TaxID=160281 RepID=A0A9P0EMX9_9HYPO|nr:unnamed protein product [Clonostachys solani]